MGTGWRRAFCTSVRRHPETTRMRTGAEKQNRSPSPSPRSCAKLSFFSGGSRASSNPSTPRLQASSPSLRCRTKPKSLDSPRLQCDTPGTVLTPTTASYTNSTTPTPTSTTPIWSPALFQRLISSAPSTPRSPSSRFPLFKHLSRSRCRICSRSLKASQETPVFTAECTHAFHLPCIASHVKSYGSLACPVCSATWQQVPFISAIHNHRHPQPEEEDVLEKRTTGEIEKRNPNRKSNSKANASRNTAKGGSERRENRTPALKVYDDDEPLQPVSTTSQGGGMRFNPIPEAAEEDKDEDDQYGVEEEADFEQREDECHGFPAIPRSYATEGASPRPKSRAWTGGVQVTVMPEAALVSVGRRHQNYVVALKIKAPPLRSAPLLDPARRAPIDLVTVLDVSQGMTGEKLQMLKRAMRMVISSLGPADRLSLVAFSSAAGTKRLLPLLRMSKQGQRSARQVVERLVVVAGAGDPGKAGQGGTSVGDALRKATKVLEDRRERNPVATIMLLSDTGQQEGQGAKKEEHHGWQQQHPFHSPSSTNAKCSDTRSNATVATTRFAHMEIPITASEIRDGQAAPPLEQELQVHYEDEFAKCVGGLVSVVMQDVRLQFGFPSGEIAAIYSSSGGASGQAVFGAGGSVRLGDLYAEEEIELLVELRLPVAEVGAYDRHYHHLSVKWNYRDPATKELVLEEEQPLLLPSLSSTCSTSTSLRLRNLFVWTRAVTESRRLVDLSDYATAHHLLCSARSLLVQSLSGDSSDQDHHLIRCLDAEISDHQLRQRQLQQQQQQQQEEALSPFLHQRRGRREAASASAAETRGEPLTPTSAWRAAEQLAKVAIMRKSMNRVGDLHGFENARF